MYIHKYFYLYLYPTIQTQPKRISKVEIDADMKAVVSQQETEATNAREKTLESANKKPMGVRVFPVLPTATVSRCNISFNSWGVFFFII